MQTVSTSLYEICLTSSTLQSCQATAVVLVAILLPLIEMPVADSRFRVTDVSGRTLEDCAMRGEILSFILRQSLTSKAPIG